MEHLSNNHENRPNQPENSHKLREKTEHPLLSLTLRQQHDQNLPMEGKPLQNKYY